MNFRWSAAKNAELKRTRGFTFEDIIQGDLLAVDSHPRRPNQRVFFIWFNEYIWFVPYVVNGDEVFLKTAYPSRKYMRMWMRGGRA